jgi:hypothetical protein
MAHLSDNITGSVMDPVRKTKSFLSNDLIRGVALQSLILINITGTAGKGHAFWDVSGYGKWIGWNLRLFLIINLLIEGTMISVN